MHDRDVPELAREPIGVLLGRLSRETTTLVREEIALAKAEIVEKGKRAAAGLALFGAAAAVGMAAFGAFTAFVIMALGLAMAGWLAALLVAVVFGGVAAALAASARQQIKLASPLVPEAAIDSTKESVEWVKTRMRSGTT